VNNYPTWLSLLVVLLVVVDIDYIFSALSCLKYAENLEHIMSDKLIIYRSQLQKIT